MIRSYVRNMYVKTGNSIVEGTVRISPYKIKDRTPCTFCSYQSVCQFDQSLEDNEYRMLVPRSKEQALEFMEKGGCAGWGRTRIPPKPERATWTDDQWKAIMASGQDILVAAAAGSGKTAVLVERIIEKILSKEEPMNVDELLSLHLPMHLQQKCAIELVRHWKRLSMKTLHPFIYGNSLVY